MDGFASAQRRSNFLKVMCLGGGRAQVHRVHQLTLILQHLKGTDCIMHWFVMTHSQNQPIATSLVIQEDQTPKPL
jgi:hypothetical protein